MTDQSAGTRTVTVEREIAQPADKLWRALTQPHLIAEWLKMQPDFAPVVGHRFGMRGEWGGVECEVLAVEPPRTLSYTWDHPHDDPAYALKSVVTFTLTPTASGTLLRMEQSGFRPEQKQALGGAMAGWRMHLENLERVASGLD